MIETFNSLQICSIFAILSLFFFITATIFQFVKKVFIRISALLKNRHCSF